MRSSGSGSCASFRSDEPGHVYHLVVCRSPERDRIRGALTEAGIGNAQYYLPPLHLQPALSYLGYEAGSLPETERAAAENFSVPLWAGITLEQQERVVDAVRAAVGVASPGLENSHQPAPVCRSSRPTSAIILAAWFLAFRLRFDPDLPRYYEYYLSFEVFGLVAALKLSVFALFGFYNRWWRYVSTRDMWGAARGVTAGVARHVPRLHALRHPRRPRAALGLGDRLAADARARRGLADARADDHRAAADELDRRARQGGDRRRGGGRGPADAARDAAHARARLHADRA